MLPQIAIAQINPILGAFAQNTRKIIHAIEVARRQGAELVLFSEMTLCGYFPEDLLLVPGFIERMESALEEIIAASQGIAVVLGTVRRSMEGEKRFANTAALIENAKLIGFQDKILLPTYDVFSEKRYFEAGGAVALWQIASCQVAITICEDIWHSHVSYTSYKRNPIQELKALKPDLVLNLSASPYHFNKQKTRISIAKECIESLNCPLVYCNQVGAHDSLIYDGNSFFMDARGRILFHAKGFEEDVALVSSHSIEKDLSSIEELYLALVLGMRDYFHKLGFSKACLGLSGGIDSAVVACIAVEALGKENVFTLGLPSRYSSEASVRDAHKIAENLGICFETLSIEAPFQSYLETLSPIFEVSGLTEENLQARIRGTLLMAFSNKQEFLLLNTANKSEMAMGYSTLYGDMCGALAVLGDVTKSQVYALAHFLKDLIPEEILIKPPSAELRVGQKDSDSLPDYAVIDAVIEGYVERHLSSKEIAQNTSIDLNLVETLIQKIHQNEYKRRQSPPCLRVTERALTAGWRFPIVQRWSQ